MFDEEIVFQRREATHDTLVSCDLCGMPTPLMALELIVRPGGEHQPAEEVRACPTCRHGIDIGELPVDTELGLEEE